MSVLRPGVSIMDHISQKISGIASLYEDEMAPLEKSRPEIRQFFLDNSIILPIPQLSENIRDSKTLATVDGGKVVQQMQIGDICISGAGLGEGALYKHVYENEKETPTLADARILQHKSSVDALVGGLMSTQELALMSMIPHEVRILDGSWTSSMTALYLTILDNKDPMVSGEFARWMLDALSSEMLEGEEIAAGVDRLISPWRYENDNVDVLALSKSDSSFSFANSLLSDENPAFYNILARHHKVDVIDGDENREHLARFKATYSDRLLATQVLQPGEMFQPRSVPTGKSLAPRLNPDNWKSIYNPPGIISTIQKLKQQKTHSKKILDVLEHSLVSSLLTQGYRDNEHKPFECFELLDDARATDNRWIWTAFVKPRNFLPQQRAMKMDYARSSTSSYIETGQRLASYVDADVTHSSIQEAFSQYVADKRAKEVSQAANLMSQYMASTTKNPMIAMGLTRSYRT